MSMTNAITVQRALLSRFGHASAHEAEKVLFASGNGVDQSAFSKALQDSKVRRDRPRSLQISLPFCPVRCLNCDSNTVITHDPKQIDRYIDSLEDEVELLVETLGFKPRLQELHLTGGTPNYLDDRQLVRLMGIIDDNFGLDQDTEQSLHANPKRTSQSQLTLLHGLGFDRIAFGVRDLDPAVQLAIGRTVSVDMIRGIFEDAREIGFKNIGTDLLYGLPCQTTDGIKRTVDTLTSLAPDRIDCFAFSRHASSRAHQSALDHCAMPSLADKMALFNAVVEGLCEDYEWIGLDSFARQDDELTLAQAEGRLYRSWTGYSHLPNVETHGLGTSAISDLDDICVQNHTTLDQWKTSLQHNEFPVQGGTLFDSTQRAQRDAIRTLMCNMELHDYASLFDNEQWTDVSLERFRSEGIFEIDHGVMRVTDEGRYVLPHLLAS
jgi:oxygen-independent coproporphyrinogen-3 oxidase